MKPGVIKLGLYGLLSTVLVHKVLVDYWIPRVPEPCLVGFQGPPPEFTFEPDVDMGITQWRFHEEEYQ